MGVALSSRQRLQNKQNELTKPDSFNRRGNTNRAGAPNRPNNNFRQGPSFKHGNLNKTGSKFNNQKSPGFRKAVSPNDLMQLQKTNASDKENYKKNNIETKNIDSSKNNIKSPDKLPTPASSPKKAPNRSFANNSKKPGKSDWDDSAKLEALRNKNPHKQRQKVHIIGENDDSLTSETSGYSGEKVTILSASLARPKEKSDEHKSQKTTKQFKKKKKKQRGKDKKEEQWN